MQVNIFNYEPHHKIHAIKAIRQHTGMGLREAKEALEQYSIPCATQIIAEELSTELVKIGVHVKSVADNIVEFIGKCEEFALDAETVVTKLENHNFSRAVKTRR